MADKKRFSLFFLLIYENKAKDAQNIKVEINLRDFGSEYIIKSYLGITMRVMTKDDMLAHKLVAMFERMGKTNRDIYDVWFFLDKQWSVNAKIIERRTGLSLNEFLENCVTVLEGLPDGGMLSGIGELVGEKQKAWIKSKLRSEVIFQLKLLINLPNGNPE